MAPSSRTALLQAAQADKVWDVLVVGGGATGLGCAMAAMLRGCSVLLVERDDFASGTSGYSSKLVHGGVRYLAQGQVGLVRESLQERAWILQHSGNLAWPLKMVLPETSRSAWLTHRMGLGVYEWLGGGGSRLGPTRTLSYHEMRTLCPGLAQSSWVGGVQFTDGQFDDARLAVALALQLLAQGAVVLNHTALESLQHDAQGRVCGATLHDRHGDVRWPVRARVVINAAGPGVDWVRSADNPCVAPSLTLSQGTHIVLPKHVWPGALGMMIPKTDDGRVLFVLPWHGAVLVGTTDLPVTGLVAPRPSMDEIDYLLAHLRPYVQRAVSRNDILSSFAGWRPLIKGEGSTAGLSREFGVEVAPSGLISPLGGKWTSFRAMAEETWPHVAAALGLAPDRHAWQNLTLQWPSGCPAPLPPGSPIARSTSDVAAWVSRTMAVTVADVLVRRTRMGLLDARRSLQAAPVVAEALAVAHGLDAAWAERESERYCAWAQTYLLAHAG